MTLNPCLNKYENSGGYFELSTIDQNKHKKQKFFTSGELPEANNYIEENKNRFNCYYSIATFTEKKRSQLNIDTIHLNFVDIDSHIAGLTKAEAVKFTEQLQPYFNNIIPEPSSIVYSGRGIQLLYSLYGAVDCVKWQLIQEGLFYKADSIVAKINVLMGAELETDFLKDTSRILRTPNTINLKSGYYSEIIYTSDHVYTQADLLEKYNLYSVEKGNKKPLKELLNIRAEDIEKASYKALRNYANTNRAYTVATLNTARIKDLLKLIEIRNKAGQLEGYRNKLINICCEIIRTSTTDINSILEQLTYINGHFEKPLRACELNAWASLKLKNPAYYYKHKTIITALQITPEEMEFMKVIRSKDLVNKKYYQAHRMQLTAKRNNKYKQTKEETQAERQKKITKAKELYSQGQSITKIAVVFNVNKSTVSRWLKD